MDSSYPPRDQIQEQRRTLTEDTVSYAIFLQPNPNQNQQESLQLARTLISSIVTELAKDYIWHKDAFSLRIDSGQGALSSSQPCLRGETRFGDSLDDEWMIVFFLKEITSRIPGSIARVQDNDGEFLLIEAADHIPSWLDPDNSDNRVFIYEGDLHIIPIAITADEKKSFPSTIGTRSKPPKLQDALDIIRSSSSISSHQSPTLTTQANTEIQQAAFGPLMPDSEKQHFAIRKIQDQRHFARCQVPVEIARILKQRPELITRATEAFYTRDAVAMAVCSRMHKFLPSTASAPLSSSLALSSSSITRQLGKNRTPFVTTRICFTKTCYAQLMGQQFQPPKSWDGIVPPPNSDDADDPQKVKEAELGMKLTCGFEILCSPDYPGDFGFKIGEEIKLEDFPFATDDSWRTFKSNLNARGYFRTERPGSKEYQHLEETAKRQFLEYKTNQLRVDQGGAMGGFGSVSYHGHGYHPIQEIEHVLGTELTSNELEALVDEGSADNDSWMDVDLQTLEDMMRTRGLGGGASMDPEKPSKAGLDMQRMLDRFGEFIQEGEGGVEGAEFLDEQSDDEEMDDSDEEDKQHDSDEEYKPAPLLERDTTNHGQEQDEHEGDEDDDDMFASDYEERQTKKQTRKQGQTTGGVFLFDSGMMTFENGVSSESKSEAKTSASRGFEMDREKLKDVLLKTFGASSRVVPSKGDSSDEKSDGAGMEMDDQGLQEYMAALDAELSGTKVGQSFEKMPAAASTSTTASESSCAPAAAPKMDKGKGLLRPAKSAKPEKNLEELMKEYADRSRRGFSRQGPLPMPDKPFGFDPAAMAFEDDEDEGDEDEDEDGARVTEISAEEEEVEEVVDMELNLAKNLLESFKSQGGLPGPGGNLLSRLGIVLPRDEGSEDEDEKIVN
ncbi:hypothetical protein BG011_006410 [Mortierella polycephala]|uniref:SGT1-domain-containing protein n=1 Tax=Mortierella polycephala TaxID=41804 RepID=A0A9P6PSV9_9FUNG|nr:hypothetical protein BG011_006410 [Mortierella polycephala]